ncbi:MULTISPECIES: enolase C-terminal domain-like protein [unclassified Variovorax]|jgi:L-alanine-DL-glutamate epimerase-like enolase superfamily enzyme|uniref:enolase C-terminal domain-like protein n=1 Tax=unclassified Variovorax TaxID=663243 RepID=UPI000F7F0A7A|nr:MULTISPECIES: enolase C-terminal domain-like protein [unclassified Variovorax]RSZ33233.1 mandelate racemase [Variovorax sp. 553]RSZ33605.1 mandelate racemase [Variovorax sp. 679]
MKIVGIAERTVPIASPLRNARVDFSEITASVVAVATDQFRDGRRVVGYAFNSFGRYGCGGPLRERFIPRLLRASPHELNDPATGIVEPGHAVDLLLKREKAGAHAERSMAVGTLELALWDIVGKMRGLPLYRVLAERFAPPGTEAPHAVRCYAGGGFYRERDDLARLGDEVRGHLDAGYTEVKIKAGGLPMTDELRRIESVLALVKSGSRLALDASCAFERQEALAFARAITPYGLRWLEEPCDPGDFETYRAVSEAYPGIVAGGENLFSREEADNFLRYGRFGGRIVLQPDPPLAYGIRELHHIVEVALAHGVARENVVPHGGNMMSLHATAGLGLGSAESYPGLFGPFGGFSREVRVHDGFATLPEAPGIGFEEQPALYGIFRELSASLGT